MKRYLLPKDGQFYKANLHSHSTMSDGDMTPEEMKAAYQAKGYSIVAYTDHEILFPHNDLTDETFIALNGVEHDVDEKDRFDRTGRKFHCCCIAIDPNNHMTPCPDESKFERFQGNLDNLHLYKPQPGTENFPRAYDPQSLNALMREVAKYGFFITYNHPEWSLEDQQTYCQYHSMHAMEIYNNGSAVLGFDEYNPKAYDALLRRGFRGYCIATDDNHNKKQRHDDSFGGWTMIKAPCLDYKTIMTALQNGSFYASQGPEIYDLWMEGDTVHIQCSPAATIQFATGQRHQQIEYAPDGGSITQSQFKLMPNDLYFRITVTGHDGTHANTNAYFLDTLDL